MLEEGREEKCSDDDGEGMEPVKVKAEDGKENGQQQEPSSSVVLSLAEDEDDQLHPRALGKTMDVEAYANMYDGYTKILRLFFIAERCGNDTMELQALSLVHQELVKGQDNRSYIQVCEKINGRLGSAFLLDHERVDAIDLSAAHQYERLETDLNDAKSSLSKESIRMGYNDLGDFYNARGDLQQAIKCFVRARDYCITTTHIVSTYIDIILAAINLGQFHNVSNYVAKAEKTPDNEDPLVLAKLQVAAGLAHLESRNYKFAARKFVDTSFNLGTTYTQVIAPHDVATYGGLCALASFDRTELKSKVMDNTNFKMFLELVPEVGELVDDFFASHYASCFGRLQKLKANLLLDIHLHDHVESLYTHIRHKALIQYTIPFFSLDLNHMADAFKTSVAGLEKELASLIMENQIQARIDSHKKVLHAWHPDQRNGMFQTALLTGYDLERETFAMLIRAHLLKHDMVVKGPEM